MTESEFDAFLAKAVAQLKSKQAHMTEEFGFGAGGRWWFEQETQRLQLFDSNDQLTVEADVIDVGSFAPLASTWMWGWCNESLLPELRGRSRPLVELESLTGYAMFGRAEAFKIEGEPMAWELAAVSVMHLGALGCYRAPSSSNPLMSFLAIMSVKPAARLLN